MDKILLIIGLIIAVAIVITGGFGTWSQSGLGVFNFLGNGGGPRASGPGASFIQAPEGTSQINSSGSLNANNPPASPAPPPGYSIYQTKVRISTVSRPSAETQNSESEYILLYYADYQSKNPIVVSGWSLENTQGKRYMIGNAARIPLVDASETTAALLPSTQAYIHTGASPLGIGFRENACTGYLNENNRFIPSLSGGCPSIDVSKLVQYNDRCLSFLQQNAGSCRMPVIAGNATVGIGDDCSDFIAKNLNYRGCVDNFRSATDFYRNTWHFYFNRPEKLWRSLHDVIILRDSQGLIVDTYQY